jgi:DNA-binding MarR family transcriptional regulator
MTDIKNPTDEAALRYGVELLFYAYRDFTADPDAILAKYGFGRAHHRVVHFVGRYPDITVAELLAILRITKQSLARVLGQLVRQGFIRQRTGERDRRQRLLSLTERGLTLDRQLSAPQHARFARAFAESGASAVEGWHKAMIHLIDPDKREQVEALLRKK